MNAAGCTVACCPHRRPGVCKLVSPHWRAGWTFLLVWVLEVGSPSFSPPSFFNFISGSGLPATPSFLSRGTADTFEIDGVCGQTLPLSLGLSPLPWPFGLFPTNIFAVASLTACPICSVSPPLVLNQTEHLLLHPSCLMIRRMTSWVCGEWGHFSCQGGRSIPCGWLEASDGCRTSEGSLGVCPWAR